MRKVIAIVLALLMVTTALFSLTACGGKELSEIEKAIADAEKMTEEQLLAKAKEEIGENELLFQGISSGFKKVADAFTTKYGIKTKTASDISKDTALYTAIGQAMDANEYFADVFLVQDTAQLLDQINQGNMFNYVPKDIKGIATSDQDPLAGIYLNKAFIYTQTKNAGDAFTLTNVWQLAGSKDDKGHISNLSFQSPSAEGINMSMLVMLTKPENETLLKTAYKEFYGKDYVDTADYKSISYKFISEFINNVSTWHTSDTTAVKGLAEGTAGATTSTAISEGTIVYGPFNKYKDAKKISGVDMSKFVTTGFTTDISGFNGYIYKMYAQIGKTAKYPYASALFIRFLMTEEGFTAGWGGNLGYYSANTTIAAAEGDQNITAWKGMIVEEPKYVYDNFEAVSKFVNTEIAKASAK